MPEIMREEVVVDIEVVLVGNLPADVKVVRGQEEGCT